MTPKIYLINLARLPDRDVVIDFEHGQIDKVVEQKSERPIAGPL